MADSEDENGYSDAESYNSEDIFQDTADDVKENLKKNTTCIKYSVLDLDDIKQRLEDAVSRVCNILSVSRSSATLLLAHYNWDVETVNEAWFSDEDEVRTKVGLLKNPVVEFSVSEYEKENCGICSKEYNSSRMYSEVCGHRFCKDCWERYITTSIQEGSGCLLLRCPEKKCRAAVNEDMINELVSDRIDKAKYSEYRVSSYVETNPNIKWCPAQDCRYLVELDQCTEDSYTNYDVTCNCMHAFCWKCREDAHRSIDCDTVAKWILKNNADAENIDWILNNTKMCPKCQKPVERDEGIPGSYSILIKCPDPCLHEFCWLCLNPYRGRGHIQCNRYREKTDRRDVADKILDKYAHYYERWAANKESRKKAISDFLELRDTGIKEFAARVGMDEFKCKFLLEAWQLIISCRRVLEWSYVYGYYLPENDKKRKELFEFAQGEAEILLEKLHCDTENGLKDCFVDFLNFRDKLWSRTFSAENYFDKLVKALENDFEGVDLGKWYCSENGLQELDLQELDLARWFCEICTLLNDRSVSRCQACGTPNQYL